MPPLVISRSHNVRLKSWSVVLKRAEIGGTVFLEVQGQEVWQSPPLYTAGDRPGEADQSERVLAAAASSEWRSAKLRQHRAPSKGRDLVLKVPARRTC